MDQFDPGYMPEQTARVFENLSEKQFISNFTLVRGTALSIQIRHRLSEDLDFIFDGPELNKSLIKRNISKHFSNFRIIREDENYQLDFIIDDVRVTFFSTGAVMIPFEVKPFSGRYKKINIAPSEIVGVLKLASISQRNTFRDYYDLYILAKYHHDLGTLIKKTRELVPTLSPITYSETLVYTDDIEEDSIASHLSPKEMVTKEEISGFFARELKKIRGDM